MGQYSQGRILILMPTNLVTQEVLPVFYLPSYHPVSSKLDTEDFRGGWVICVYTQRLKWLGMTTSFLWCWYVMLIWDNIVRNLLNGFLVRVFNVSPCNKTAPHHVSFCAVNAIMIRPITALTVLKEIKHLGDSFSATLIELKWCC